MLGSGDGDTKWIALLLVTGVLGLIGAALILMTMGRGHSIALIVVVGVLFDFVVAGMFLRRRLRARRTSRTGIDY